MRVIKRIKAVGVLLMLGVSVISGTVVQAKEKPVFHAVDGKYDPKKLKKYVIYYDPMNYPKGKVTEKQKKEWEQHMQDVVDWQNITSFKEQDGRYVLPWLTVKEWIKKHRDGCPYALSYGEEPKITLLGLGSCGDIKPVFYVKPLKNAKVPYSGGVSVEKEEYTKIGRQLEDLGFKQAKITDIIVDYCDLGSLRGDYESEKLGKEVPKTGWRSIAYTYHNEDTGARIVVYVRPQNKDIIPDTRKRTEMQYVLSKQEKKEVEQYLKDWEKSSNYVVKVRDYSVYRKDERFQKLKQTLKITHRWYLDIPEYKKHCDKWGVSYYVAGTADHPVCLDKYGEYSIGIEMQGVKGNKEFNYKEF